jgi:hypothetical protein
MTVCTFTELTLVAVINEVANAALVAGDIV